MTRARLARFAAFGAWTGAAWWLLTGGPLLTAAGAVMLAVCPAGVTAAWLFAPRAVMPPSLYLTRLRLTPAWLFSRFRRSPRARVAAGIVAVLSGIALIIILAGGGGPACREQAAAGARLAARPHMTCAPAPARAAR